MKYSCCIEMLFTEYAFADRIHKAKEAGFDGVEFWCWEDKDLEAVKKALDDTGLRLAVFQGNTKGRMTDPKDLELYVRGVERSAETAAYLGAKNLFLMSDILKEDRSVLEAPYPLSAGEKKAASAEVLKALVPLAKEKDLHFVIEPLNTKVDHRGYSLSSSRAGAEILREVNDPHMRLLYDAYHMQIMEGNVIDTVRELWEWFGYFHIADVPGRCQPGTGELNYRNILKALGDTGYEGYVGFEFEARGVPDMEVCKACLGELRNKDKE